MKIKNIKSAVLFYDTRTLFRNKKHNKNSLRTCENIVPLFLITFAVLSTSFLTNATAQENNSCSGTGASTVSLELSSNTASTDISVSSDSGVFASSNPVDITVRSNNCSGYNLSIRAANYSSSDATNLINTSNPEEKILSISEVLSETDFSSPTNTQYNNKWGYKPNKKYDRTTNSNLDNTTNFYPSPTDVGDVLSVTSGPVTDSDTYSIEIGARIDSTITAGAYSNTFIISALANPTSYSISYDPNAEDDTVSNLPSPNSGDTYDDHVTIASDTPRRVGYDFVSWCTNNESQTSCSGESYSPGGTYPINQLSSIGNDQTLYAIWELGTYTLLPNKNSDDAQGIEEGYTFTYKGSFSWDPSVTQTILKANNYKRDGYGFAGWSTDPNVADSINNATHSYVYGPNEMFDTSNYDFVSHADDNHIIPLYAVWVPSSGNMQNWSGCASLGSGKITALTDTRDNQTYTVAKLGDGKCWMIENFRLNPGQVTITNQNTNNPTANFISQVANKSSTEDSNWCIQATAACSDIVAFNTTNLEHLSSAPGYGEAYFGYGVYYNWYTATAGNGTHSITPTSTQPNGDICPKGWHLPTGGTNGELASLFSFIVNANISRNFPTNFVLSGGIFDNGIQNRQVNAFYLSSTASHQNNAYNMFLYDFYRETGGFSSKNASYKSRGIPFRCLAN